MSDHDDSVETCSIKVTQYLHRNGDVGYQISRKGDANLSTQVGLLELAKAGIIEEYNRESEE